MNSDVKDFKSREHINMKIVTVNINPPDKCQALLKLEFKQMTIEERAQRIYKIVKDKYADIVFFTEQFGPVYDLVKRKLENDYEFYLPNGFKPSVRSYAGIVTAVSKKHLNISKIDGKQYVNESKRFKFLSIQIEDRSYLCVHTPQPGSDIYIDFYNGINKFIKEHRPIVICGDFNTEKGTVTEFEGYKDCLPVDYTSAFGTKLDYIFVREDSANQVLLKEGKVIKEAMQSGHELLCSDHAVTIVELKEI